MAVPDPTTGKACNQRQEPTSTTVHIGIDDNRPESQLRVSVTFSALARGARITVDSGTAAWQSGTDFTVTFGPVPHNKGLAFQNSIDATVTAVDRAGNRATVTNVSVGLTLIDCDNG